MEYVLLAALLAVVSLGSISWVEDRAGETFSSSFCSDVCETAGPATPTSATSSTSTSTPAAPTSTSSTSTSSSSTTSPPPGPTTTTAAPTTTSTTAPPGGQVSLSSGARRQDVNNWEAIATAAMVDESSQPLAGATVTFELTEQPSGRVTRSTCTTSASGSCTVRLSNLDRRGGGRVNSVDIAVVTVSGGTSPWNGVIPPPDTVNRV